MSDKNDWSAVQQRVEQTSADRQKVRKLVFEGKWKQAESDPDRLNGFMSRKTDNSPRKGAESVVGNTIDFQAVKFLPSGSRIRRAIAFVEVNTPQYSELGSGFLISPDLFLTCQHVIQDAEAAKEAQITFDREMDEQYRPRPTTTFLLDPEKLAIFSKQDELDYALIAVGPLNAGSASVKDFGFCQLSNTPNRHVLGMNVNIIQHPSGWPKMLAFRNNLLTARTDETLLYETDTDTGSSGSPVFNDDWEVVALHHWGQPFLKKIDDKGQPIPSNINEGVRISAIYNDLVLKMPTLTEAQQALLKEALSNNTAMADSQGHTLSPPHPVQQGPEGLRVETDYGNRKGYDPGFIPSVEIPLPALTEPLVNQLAPLIGAGSVGSAELKYTHFSILMNRNKRIAIYTATNIDGETYLVVDRTTGEVKDSEGDTWYKDPRISNDYILDQSFYKDWSTYFDKGHLTRRSDPSWGTPDEAEQANTDTFHFTNCSPQHFRFNESATYWQGVERYVLENGLLANDSKKRINVYQGPVFNDKIDHWADSVQIPSSFFKIIVWPAASGLKAVGIVVDQLSLLSETRKYLGQPENLPSVNVNHWRVAIPVIEKRTGIDFGDIIRQADTISSASQPPVGSEGARPILSFKDILN